MIRSSDVFAVIVAYNPDPARLASILDRAAAQCRVIIADNSDRQGCAETISAMAATHGAFYLSMHGNQGIGRAQNVAIEEAWRLGGSAVLLLDDDSMPASDLVAVLVASMPHATNGRAVLCARPRDAEGRDIGNVRMSSDALVPCRELMSSGSLITRTVHEAVGAFDADLFIDGVDFDWGWRAQRLGIPIFIVREAHLQHRLGTGQVGPLKVPSPIRHYYQYRNVLHLMRRSHAPWPWILSQAIKLPTKLVLIAILTPPRRSRLRFALSGVRDAMKGRVGKYMTTVGTGNPA